jgi:hypothetical protein
VWGDGEMGRWGDGEMGRWGDGEMGRINKSNLLRRISTGYHTKSRRAEKLLFLNKIT